MSVVDNLRFVFQRLSGQRTRCRHVNLIAEVEPQSTAGCPECLAAGDSWRALRMCMSCGHVGCCDSSKNRHARRHAVGAQHPIIRSIEPGDDWMWCFEDRRLIAPP